MEKLEKKREAINWSIRMIKGVLYFTRHLFKRGNSSMEKTRIKERIKYPFRALMYYLFITREIYLSIAVTMMIFGAIGVLEVLLTGEVHMTVNASDVNAYFHSFVNMMSVILVFNLLMGLVLKRIPLFVDGGFVKSVISAMVGIAIGILEMMIFLCGIKFNVGEPSRLDPYWYYFIAHGSIAFIAYFFLYSLYVSLYVEKGLFIKPSGKGICITGSDIYSGWFNEQFRDIHISKSYVLKGRRGVNEKRIYRS